MGSASEPDSASTVEPESHGPPTGVPTVEARKRKSRALRWVVEVVVIVAAAFVLALLVQQFLVKPYAIPSPSMATTLVDGDRVLVNRVVYHFRSPSRGDVIVFYPPGRSHSDPFIKRVVAVGGDVVAIRDGYLYLNGVRQDEDYVMEYPILGLLAETEIPAGHVWVMGDNRNNSGDSRVFGPVSEDDIMGRAFITYWPPGHIRGL